MTPGPKPRRYSERDLCVMLVLGFVLGGLMDRAIFTLLQGIGVSWTVAVKKFLESFYYLAPAYLILILIKDFTKEDEEA